MGPGRKAGIEARRKKGGTTRPQFLQTHKKRGLPEGGSGKPRPRTAARKGFNNRGWLLREGGRKSVQKQTKANAGCPRLSKRPKGEAQSFFCACAACTILETNMGGTSS